MKSILQHSFGELASKPYLDSLPGDSIEGRIPFLMHILVNLVRKDHLVTQQNPSVENINHDLIEDLLILPRSTREDLVIILL
jgi:hypothetical protein